METSPYGELPPKKPDPPLKISEWPDVRLNWELEHRAHPLMLAQIMFEIMMREAHPEWRIPEVDHEASEQD